MSEPWVKMKRGLFYAPNDCGYTGIRDLAGRYSEENARAETACEGVTAMPLRDAPEFSSACYDDLARKHLAGQRDELRRLIAGVIERCEPTGYVGRDGQYLKQLRAAVDH